MGRVRAFFPEGTSRLEAEGQTESACEEGGRACWVVINRVESSDYPDDLESVLWQEGQFCEFSDAEPPTEGNFTIATNQLSRFYNGDIRPVPSTAVFITVSDEGVVLRDSWEETAKTQHWRA